MGISRMQGLKQLATPGNPLLYNTPRSVCFKILGVTLRYWEWHFVFQVGSWESDVTWISALSRPLRCDYPSFTETHAPVHAGTKLHRQDSNVILRCSKEHPTRWALAVMWHSHLPDVTFTSTWCDIHIYPQHIHTLLGVGPTGGYQYCEYSQRSTERLDAWDVTRVGCMRRVTPNI